MSGVPRSAPRRLIVLGAIALGLFGAAAFARRALGIDLDPGSVRSAVADLGIWAPVVYVGIMTFRIPLWLPSQLVLIAGGLVFGTAIGTLYGALGITLSGALMFLGARWSGRDAVMRRVPQRFTPLMEVASRRLGALFLVVATAYPLGPITAYHALAGLTAMSLGTFVAAVFLGSLGRAVTYTYFGSSLVGGDVGRIAGGAAVVALAAAVPLLHPRSRRWVREMMRGRGSAEAGSEPEGSQGESRGTR